MLATATVRDHSSLTLIVRALDSFPDANDVNGHQASRVTAQGLWPSTVASSMDSIAMSGGAIAVPMPDLKSTRK
ncbi:hypothetical protein Pla52o_37030 [Novipirellula galeiformis]|uniref:Uncharacterized protein n=1 Tax=Novipirellula galeiformis TaxID=2528004 RepID=A0A5C6CDS7_9BACT|nr:hypothetical protein Pla52o_37030 [Novipirellula galeiformis]